MGVGIRQPQPRPTPPMDSKASTTRHPTSRNIETNVVPRIPQEIINEILVHLATDPASSANLSLRSCSLVSKSWVSPCRQHLFYTIFFFSPKHIDKWLRTFPVPEESPAHYVRDLSIWLGGGDCVPEREIFKYTSWFINVEKLTLSGYGAFSLSRTTSLWRLPQSVTSLAIQTNMLTLVDIRDIMAQLPNLDHLSVSGHLVDGVVPPGIGTALRGRFSGKLRLSAREDFVNMLMEVPNGLHFTEVDIFGEHKSLLSTVRLADACGDTVAKLKYVTSTHGKSHSFLSGWFYGLR